MNSGVSIVRGLGGAPDVVRADMLFLEGRGALFAAHSPAGAREVFIPCLWEIATRPEVRESLFALPDQATAAIEAERSC